MDIAQILITLGSILGIALVALIAIVPTAMEIPAPEKTPTTKPLHQPQTGATAKGRPGHRPVHGRLHAGV